MSSDTDSTWQDGDSKLDTPGSNAGPEDMGSHDCEIEFIDQLDDPEGWEIGVGFGEELRPLWRGSVGHRESFEVAARDGVDLSNPCPVDLLSDTPIEDDPTSFGLTTAQAGSTLPYADTHATPYYPSTH
ncbi:hypothetical protein RHS02_07316, partial [Rhizoctonia solani]